MRKTWMLVIAIVAGCGAPAPMSSAPAPPSNGKQLIAGPYTVPAGTEKYFCYATTLAEAPAAITQIQSYQPKTVHHMALFRTIKTEPEGFSECPVLIKTSWLPLFAGGAGSGATMKLPDGAGFKLAGNEQLLIQLHLLNATAAPVTDTMYLNMSYSSDPATVTPAGLWAWGNFNVDMPLGDHAYKLEAGCAVGKDLNIFGWFPHMHKLGTRVQLEVGPDEQHTSVVYQRSPWVFDDQHIDQTPMTVKAGQFAKASCVFDNTTDHAVKFGESTNDEMCILSVFYTPFKGLDGCIIGYNGQ